MTIAQIYLAALLGLMALGQLVSWRTFPSAVAAYGVRRPRMWAASFIVGEATAALLLVPLPTRLGGSVLALVVAIAWTGLAVVAFAQRRRLTNCGCFGRFAPQPLRWWVLLEDAAFVGLAVWATLQAASPPGR